MMYALAKPRVAAFALLFGAAMNCASFGDLSAQPVRKQVATRGPARAVWTKERARAWADSTGWLVGSNFIPSTAINQLEMWQATTFDPTTIDRELGWASAAKLSMLASCEPGSGVPVTPSQASST